MIIVFRKNKLTNKQSPVFGLSNVKAVGSDSISAATTGVLLARGGSVVFDP